MKTVLHKAATRGHADHGWLNSWHSFSFAGYHNTERMHFGVLRVLNDDTVAGGMGFGRHPHDNMEIVSIPLEGALEHQDSTGTKAIIRQGDVQIMSAGTGIEHSEKNAHRDQPVKFLQIWVFPNKKNVPPRYDQKTFTSEDRRNQFQTVVAPMGQPEGVQIYQDAWFSLCDLEQGKTIEYPFHKAGNGAYVFVLHGAVTVNEIALDKRDGLGISETDRLLFNAGSDASILLMEVPMLS